MAMTSPLLISTLLIFFLLMVTTDSAKSSPRFKMFGIQGDIICKDSNGHLTPIDGAMARITCRKGTQQITKLTPATKNFGRYRVFFNTSDLPPGMTPWGCRAFEIFSPNLNCNIPYNITKYTVEGVVPRDRLRLNEKEGKPGKQKMWLYLMRFLLYKPVELISPPPPSPPQIPATPPPPPPNESHPPQIPSTPTPDVA